MKPRVRMVARHLAFLILTANLLNLSSCPRALSAENPEVSAAVERHLKVQNSEDLFQIAFSCVTNRQHEIAFRLFENLAKRGHRKSEFWFGLFQEGVGGQLEPNGNAALSWYQKAANGSDTDAQFHLGFLYSVGRLVPRNQDLAKHWFAKAAQQGHQAAKEELDYLAWEKKSGKGTAFTTDALRASAKKGNLEAEYLSLMVATTKLGASKEERKAAWQDRLSSFKKLAAQGCSLAQLTLASSLWQTERTEATNWLARFQANRDKTLAEAKTGNAEAQYSMAYFNAVMAAIKPDESAELRHESEERLKQAAIRGNVLAQFSLGKRSRPHQTNSAVYSYSARWLYKAANRGFLSAQQELVDCYPDPSARARLKDAVNRPIELHLQRMPRSGYSYPVDDEERTKWVKECASQGDVARQVELAECLEQGWGVTASPKASLEWYCRAAESGHKDAAVRAGNIYRDGRGTEQNYKLASKYYRLVCEKPVHLDQGTATEMQQSSIDEQFAEIQHQHHRVNFWEYRDVSEKLLDCYQHTGDLQEAELVRRRRFALTLAYAQQRSDLGWELTVGEAYYTGDGVTQNLDEAFNWFSKAAAKGDNRAKLMIAAMYEKGECRFKGPTDAVPIYKELAEAGDAVGQHNLAKLYVSGFGVARDYVEAYMWSNLAAAQGLEAAVKLRQSLELQMTPEQIAEAQRRSSAFVARKHRRGDNAQRQSKVRVDAPKATGTGFAVAADGYVLTNFHVIEKADSIKVLSKAGLISARFLKADRVNDLALLKVSSILKPLPLASTKKIKLGESVFTLGFPNPSLQGFEPKLTKGEISSLAGIQDDPRHFQISVPIQPGNSGGALVDLHGNVVGVTTAQLHQGVALAATGSLAQNVNYALKVSYAAAFLDTVSELATSLKEPYPSKQRVFDDVVKEVEDATVMVLAY